MTEALHDVATLEEVDRDVAVREAAEAVRGDTRAALLRKGGILAGTALAFAALPKGIALAQGTSASDIKILNYALTLEYLEAAFYAEAVAKGKLNGIVAKFAQVVAAHEAAHVDALKKALGSKAVKSPSSTSRAPRATRRRSCSTAKVLEDTGVAAYQGQAPQIKTPRCSARPARSSLSRPVTPPGCGTSSARASRPRHPTRSDADVDDRSAGCRQGHRLHQVLKERWT